MKKNQSTVNCESGGVYNNLPWNSYHFTKLQRYNNGDELILPQANMKEICGWTGDSCSVLFINKNNITEFINYTISTVEVDPGNISWWQTLLAGLGIINI